MYKNCARGRVVGGAISEGNSLQNHAAREGVLMDRSSGALLSQRKKSRDAPRRRSLQNDEAIRDLH